MGIPSYFSFIVKNHDNIIKKLCKLDKNIDNFYLDSNSIIYDSLRQLESEFKGNDADFEKLLQKQVCLKIDEYIKTINPKITVIRAITGDTLNANNVYIIRFDIVISDILM